MRVLYLSPGLFDKGGIARYGRFQVQALRDAGADLDVFSLMARRAGDLETPFVVDYAGDEPLNTMSRARYVARAMGRMAKRRPDIVWSGHLNLGPLAWSLARASGAQLVQNIYGREVWSPVSPLRRAALRRTNLVVSDCHNSEERARSLGLVRGTSTVIWDCVDLEKLTPGERDPDLAARYGVPQFSGTTILFLGRLHQHTRYKGTERVIALLATLPDTVRLVFAGKGDDVDHLRDLATRTGVAARVSFTGPIDEADMQAIYRIADVFFLVSAAGPGEGEGIPLTPLEAMACGVPVLVGNQDGSRETLEGGGGWCGAPTDLVGQGNYILRLANDRDFAAREGRAARQRAEGAFAYPVFATKTARALRALEH